MNHLKKEYPKFILSLCICLLLSSFSRAQFLCDGFQAQAGQGVVAWSNGLSKFNKFYARDGQRGIGRTAFASSLYANYAPIKQLKVATVLPYISVKDQEQGGLQDAFIQLQFIPLSFNNTQIYFLSGYGLPLSDYETESAFSIGQQAEVFAFGFGLQKQWSKTFINAAYQYQTKSNPTPPAYQWQLKGGYFSGPWFLALRLDSQKSTGGSNYPDPNGQPFTSLGVDFTKISAEAYRHIKGPWGLSASLGQTLSGRNTGNTLDIYIGIIGTFSKP